MKAAVITKQRGLSEILDLGREIVVEIDKFKGTMVDRSKS